MSTGSGKKEEEMDEWIPPNRPLVGDQGQAHLYKQAERVQETEERLEEAMFTISDDDSQEDILRKLEEVLALEEKLEELRAKLARGKEVLSFLTRYEHEFVSSGVKGLSMTGAVAAEIEGGDDGGGGSSTPLQVK